MKRKYSSPSQRSRSDIRGKRRKTNLILNLLIGFVILLIIVVSAKIFLGGNSEETAGKKSETDVIDTEKENETAEDERAEAENENDGQSENNTTQEDSSSADEETVDTSEKESDSKPEKQEIAPASEEDAVVTPGGEEENVIKTIENPSWQPIGTSQSGEHTSVYDADSVDWAEMLQAISYATGVEKDNMTVWFLGNNGHNKSVGTISSKDQQKKYRVYIKWVDGQGWKPEKVEELNKIENQ
ncbi:DUF1510 family protein [Bacillus sp. DTU_2020_1000418_1_SI_GHA_SEK_038]|uniref:YrrS family protein n=1 Tax=Bacillus sp. DTU_2020_1000418_1_SI_GHA_SEK_038 TaxID=3077585 RepID=UPI0028E39B7C|nr:DUF1510 family protein [Bacillus sp. DTU_2020_1000418_1_SI_GHA_SEK_038]WNS74388.1 DUF1510 family protein [Bacillus sp. DTU_2020_1000418_1_SI_GHA_SEK_038]